MKNTKKQALYYLENASLLIIGITLLALPLFFLSTTTDAFVFPKQILLSVSVSILAVLFGVRTIIEGKIKFRTTPFDIPVLLLTIFALISSFISINRYDALTAFMPFLFVALLFFLITNTVRHENSLLFIISALVLGTSLSALLSVLSYFKIYILPFPYTQVTYFNTFGSLLDQAIYYALILPITAYFIVSLVKTLNSGKKTGSEQAKNMPVSAAFSVSFLIILGGLAITAYQLMTTQKPLILPLETGFQTAFAAISQDNGRIFWGFLFGSGFGTYLTDFMRFKSPAYNLSQDLWSFTFFRSSTFVLELLATTGITGLLAFIFLIFRILKERNFFIPLIIAVVLSLLLPFSFTTIILFFVLLGIFAATRAHNNPEKFAETEFYFVALKRGLLAARTEGESISLNTTERKYSKLLPIFLFIVLISLVGFPLYFSARLFLSDILYKNSLVAYSQNNGLQTYNLQLAAITAYPYRDLYYRGLSQTNLALANALALQQKEGKTADTQAQQNILLLIQQAISAGRNATTIAPATSFNWSNLSSIYRSLIGFGQNADQFAVQTNQQAIQLDPNNPQQYIDLGGIYYQVGLYDDAIRQFQIAINLKRDYANAYYNLGHALESKGNLKEALASYQAVRTLVANNKESSDKITAEIQALQNKLTEQANQAAQQNQTAVNTPSSTANEPLQINKPETQLPERKPQVSIPAPTISPIPSPTKGASSTTPTPTTTTPTINP